MFSKLCDRVEENLDETLTHYRLLLQHHKYLKSTNMLERINEEIRRRARVIGIFRDEARGLKLIRALAVETHENWSDAIHCVGRTCSRSTGRRRCGESRRRREADCGS